MTQTARTETAEEVLPLTEARYGHDELNFAEFPLVVLADRPPPGVKTIHYQDEYEDPRTGKIISRKVTITGSGEHGLPTAKDEEVLIGLLYLTKRANNFSDATVHFNRRDFLHILGWPEEGRYYHRLAESLYRWLGVTVRFENCWWDADKNRYGTEAFHLLDNVSIYDERTRGNPNGPGQLSLPLSSFHWNDIPFKSFRRDYMKGLDLELFLRLPGAAAKRAYRFLDKSLPAEGPLAYDLRLFACEKVGMSRNYKPSRLITEVQATVVGPLEKANFLAPLDPKERFVKESRGHYRVLFARQGQAESLPVSATPADTLTAELRRLRISGKKAREVMAAYPQEYILAKIDIVDWLRQGKQAQELRNPAGFLLKALENDYLPPEGYESPLQREERARREQEHRERQCQWQQQHEEGERTREERERAIQSARREQINACWQGLSAAEQAELEKRALAQADDMQRNWLRGDGPLAEVTRQILIDNEILRLHPWPSGTSVATADALS